MQDQEEDKNRNFEVITVVQNAIKQGFLDWSPRLLMAMYSCDIQASSMSPAGMQKEILTPRS